MIMNKSLKLFEYIYLIIAIVFSVKAFNTLEINPKQAYIYMAFSALAVLMYFYRKNSHKKLED